MSMCSLIKDYLLVQKSWSANSPYFYRLWLGFWKFSAFKTKLTGRNNQQQPVTGLLSSYTKISVLFIYLYSFSALFQIAVFSGNVRNKQDSGSRDHLAAQLHATGDWGTTYALAPVPRSQNYGDMVRVIGESTTYNQCTFCYWIGCCFVT